VRYTVCQFGIRHNDQIAMKVTICGRKARGDTRAVKEYELRRRDFSEVANFDFGIQELIGARDDPTIGVFGMDFYAVMDCPGSRVVKRKIMWARISSNHR
jgi:large subunit ribosomal protein L11e